ncbi:MAG: hypothetical protein WBF53_08240, partial [Litorimonas sp.]
ILFLAVLPQFLAGGVFAYVRMRFGLGAVMGFHAIYNAALIALAVLATSLSGGIEPPGDAPAATLVPAALSASALLR